jgi:ribosomal subunit interface protein
MISYKITADTITISDAVRAYIEKRFAGFERFMDDKVSHEISATISQTTARHRDDSIKVEVSFKIHQRDFLATGTGVDVHSAIDMAKEELMREVTHSNAKRRTLFHRGARKIKDLMRSWKKE